MKDAKTKAIRYLRYYGKRIHDGATMEEISHVIRGAKNGSRHAEYVRRWLAEQPPLPHVQLVGSPQINLMKRKDLTWRHPRDADIDAGQPAMLTMQGIGNFKQPGGFIPVVDSW